MVVVWLQVVPKKIKKVFKVLKIVFQMEIKLGVVILVVEKITNCLPHRFFPGRHLLNVFNAQVIENYF